MILHATAALLKRNELLKGAFVCFCWKSLGLTTTSHILKIVKTFDTKFDTQFTSAWSHVNISTSFKHPLSQTAKNF